MIRFLMIGIPLLVGFMAIGLPFCEAVVHGFDTDAWPPETVLPTTWFAHFVGSNVLEISRTFHRLATSTHPAFANGGAWVFWSLLPAWLVVAVLLASPKIDRPWRDPATIFGGARFANPAEIAGMKNGIEIGHADDPDQIVRVEVEGNLLSIAPPRSGKTSGLIINNLLAQDDNLSWNGSAIVIDPKGEVYKAVRKRRAHFGREIFVLDMRQGSKKSSQWNPLASADTNDVLGLMRVARALIPEMSGESLYFRERAVSLLAGVIAAAVHEAKTEGRRASPADVERLLNDEEATLALVAGQDVPLLRSLARDLTLDERIRGSIISTAKLGTQWLLDPYLRALTEESTLNLEAVARGQADLFVIVPTEHFETISPVLRWLLSDLFTAVRRLRKPDDRRILLLIDEAASLGGFSQLPVALGELPGLGLSIWTFWQSRSQIVKAYGEAGADLFGTTAEFSTFSDVGGLDTGSPEFFSKLLGDITVDVPGTSEQKAEGKSSFTSSTGKQATRLVPPGDMSQFTDDRLILIPNSRRYARRPVCLDKIRYFEESRFKGLATFIKPAGRKG
ncbi:type IV secretory system conjugative DNA transfer family protein [Aureimonas glaciei]|nr:type IV secretory system conjugative DNA transfer family protein [Aureimonas glaciei]